MQHCLEALDLACLACLLANHGKAAMCFRMIGVHLECALETASSLVEAARDTQQAAKAIPGICEIWVQSERRPEKSASLAGTSCVLSSAPPRPWCVAALFGSSSMARRWHSMASLKRPRWPGPVQGQCAVRHSPAAMPAPYATQISASAKRSMPMSAAAQLAYAPANSRSSSVARPA